MKAKIILTITIMSCSIYGTQGQTLAARMGYELQTVHPGQCKNTHIGCTGSCAERPYSNARISINTTIPNLSVGSGSDTERLRIIEHADEHTAAIAREHSKTLSQHKAKVPDKIVSSENLFFIAYQKFFFQKLFSVFARIHNIVSIGLYAFYL